MTSILKHIEKLEMSYIYIYIFFFFFFFFFFFGFSVFTDIVLTLELKNPGIHNFKPCTVNCKKEVITR